MKAKCYVLKEDVVITFTPEEICDLIIICEGSKVFNYENMRKHSTNTTPYKDYKRMAEAAKRMQSKIIKIRNSHGTLEELEA